LRIEDTDQERSTKAAVDAIIDGMNWLGLDYDQGPVFQTDRMPRYKQIIEQLLNEGKAYRCYCSKDRLEKLRETQMANKEKPRYDGHCRNLNSTSNASAAPHVVRFKNPTAGSVIFDDLIRGQIEVQNSELDDLVLVRTDGMPTYNFAVVIDDWDMNITTVIRGDDHINNTPRQINILLALGVTPPQYAHAPMILGGDGQRLSKRHGAVSVTQYRDEGYLPEAMLNYLVRLGWSHGNQEIFSKTEMIDLFDVHDVNRAPAIFNLEKLSWLNQHYLKTENPDYIAALLAKKLQEQGVDFTFGPDLIAVVKALRERSKTLLELAEKAACFYCDITHYDAEITQQYFNKQLLPVFECLQTKLKTLAEWSEANIHEAVKETMTTFKLKMPELAQPLRVALTGNIHSPGIDLTLFLMGHDRVMRAINRAMEYIVANVSN
ncbi:MAG: glutamate--tRNA ligase, partial [Gammaproteobacteria bacterium]|nr:glutamate--tRNA ligase [Gammaproteobacteria bacterium]